MQAARYSQELDAVLEHARELADGSSRRLNSAHLLLALFTIPNQAQHYLREHKIDEDSLLERVSRVRDDPNGQMDEILNRAATMGSGSSSQTVTSLHLLTALCGFKDSSGYRLMRQTGVDIAKLRTTAMGFVLNNDLPRRFRVKPGDRPSPQPVGVAERDGRQRASLSFHPSLERQNRRLTTTKTTPKSPKKPESKSGKPSMKGQAHADLAKRLFGRPTPTAEVKAETKIQLPQRPVKAKAKQRAVTIPPKRKPKARDPGEKYELSPKDFPTLVKYGRNLTAQAARGKIDPVVGRETEIGQLIDILNKRRSNNPILVGPSGVGKTAIVEGLARTIVGDEALGLADNVIVEIEAGRIFGGTQLRGSLSERLVALKDEVEAAKGQVIVFLDEIHRWVGAAQDQGPDGVEELKPALARGTFPCVGATTDEEYARAFEKEPAFSRRFQSVRVEEPSIEATIVILHGLRDDYAAHHNVEISDAALDAAAKLSHRYLLERRNPDKAIAVLDLCGSRARRLKSREVDEALVAEVVGEMSGVPAGKLLMSDRERFLQMEDHLMKAVVGHERNLARIAHVIRRNYAGFVTGRPIGSFLFLGPTGVGKTETAKVLAEFLFDDHSALTTVDMSEYREAQSVAKMIGSPPGYVGHETGGQLTEAIRKRPYQIVLLDEVEKAHPAVQNLLLQLLDEARLTDSRGRTADFSNAIVVMTSNLGGAVATSPRQSVGFGRVGESEDSREEQVREAAKAALEPELWNRIDEALVFNPLTHEQVERIAHLKLQQSSKRLLDEKGIAYVCSPAVVDFLLEHGGFEPELGARPLRRALERYVEGPIADLILRGDITPPSELAVDVEDGELVFDVA